MKNRSKISTKRKFVADGVFYAELNELLTRELAEDGYAGVEVRTTPHRTEIIIRATKTPPPRPSSSLSVQMRLGIITQGYAKQQL